MPDYSNGKIYTIRCKTDDKLIYVGSTVMRLCKRWWDHKKDMKRGSNSFFYQQVKDWDEWYIELYENCPCNNVEELKKREGEVIREIGTVNTQIPGRTSKEYEQDCCEKIRERKAKITLCECGGKYTASHKQSHLHTQKHSKWIEKNKKLI